ncbi:MAG: hypothetical protein ACQEQE_06730 [Bacillota bacterium]
MEKNKFFIIETEAQSNIADIVATLCNLMMIYIVYIIRNISNLPGVFHMDISHSVIIWGVY